MKTKFFANLAVLFLSVVLGSNAFGQDFYLSEYDAAIAESECWDDFGPCDPDEVECSDVDLEEFCGGINKRRRQRQRYPVETETGEAATTSPETGNDPSLTDGGSRSLELPADFPVGTDPVLKEFETEEFIDALPPEYQEVAAIVAGKVEPISREDFEKGIFKMAENIEAISPGNAVIVVSQGPTTSEPWVAQQVTAALDPDGVEILNIKDPAEREQFLSLPPGSVIHIVDDGLFSGRQVTGVIGELKETREDLKIHVHVVGATERGKEAVIETGAEVHPAIDIPTIGSVVPPELHHLIDDIFTSDQSPLNFMYCKEPALVVSQPTFIIGTTPVVGLKYDVNCPYKPQEE